MTAINRKRIIIASNKKGKEVGANQQFIFEFGWAEGNGWVVTYPIITNIYTKSYYTE